MPNVRLSTILQRMTLSAPTRDAIGLTVNGETRRIEAGSTLAGLLQALRIDARTVVIEHNGAIVRDREHLADITLADGDALEIVHFVGGG